LGFNLDLKIFISEPKYIILGDKYEKN
jgi:hypothetical protein